jgi:hypothetical protein
MNNFKEAEERMNDRQIFHSTIQEFHIADMKFRSCLCVAPAF